MPKLSVQKINREEIIRSLKDVVDHNADSQIVDLRYEKIENAVMLTFITEGGDELSVDLAELLYRRDEGGSELGPNGASEQESGVIAIVTESEAKQGLDDTKAMTALKTAQVLDAKNLPNFQFDDEPVTGQIVTLFVDEEGEITLVNSANVGTPDAALFDDVAKRGTADQKGRTTQKLKLLGGLLATLPTTSNATFPHLVLGPDGTVYQYTGPVAPTPDPVPVFTAGTHYELVVVGPAFRGYVDIADCFGVYGWTIDDANESAEVAVDIRLNGTKVATVQPNIARPDLGGRKGFGWDVPAIYRTGTALTWSVFIAGTNQELTFSPVTTAVCPGGNAGPIVNSYPDTVITANGAHSLDLSSIFTDDNALSWRATGGGGEPLPSGLLFQPGSHQLLIDEGFANQALAIVVFATDGVNPEVSDAFLLTISRNSAPPRSEIGRTIPGPNFLNEGSTNNFQLIVSFNDGTQENHTVPATPTLEQWRDGEVIDDNGDVTIPGNRIPGDEHELLVVFTENGIRTVKSTRVVDTSVLTNPPPTAGDYGPITITQGGDQTFVVPESVFSDPGDTLTWLPATTNQGAALPNGLQFNPSTRTFLVPAGYPSVQQALRLAVRDTAGQEVEIFFLLKVDRTQSTGFSFGTHYQAFPQN